MRDAGEFESEWCVLIDGQPVNEAIDSLLVVHGHPVVIQGFALWIRRAGWDLSGMRPNFESIVTSNQNSERILALLDIKVLASIEQKQLKLIKTPILVIATKSDLCREFHKIPVQKIRGVLSPNSDFSTFRQAVGQAVDNAQNSQFIDPHLQSEWDKLFQSKAFSLTPRQHEIVCLVADGKSSKQIARLLGLQQKTIENHRAEIMRRMDVSCAAEMIRKAAQAGVIGGH